MRRPRIPRPENGGSPMTYGEYKDFGELYRAAFAERDPAIKALRLKRQIAKKQAKSQAA